jgi:hypothetical protein
MEQGPCGAAGSAHLRSHGGGNDRGSPQRRAPPGDIQAAAGSGGNGSARQAPGPRVSRSDARGKLRSIETRGPPDGSRGLPTERDRLVITGTAARATNS